MPTSMGSPRLRSQSLELVADYANPAGNMAWVEFEQQINGLPVFQGLVRGGFTRKWRAGADDRTARRGPRRRRRSRPRRR